MISLQLISPSQSCLCPPPSNAHLLWNAGPQTLPPLHHSHIYRQSANPFIHWRFFTWLTVLLLHYITLHHAFQPWSLMFTSVPWTQFLNFIVSSPFCISLGRCLLCHLFYVHFKHPTLQKPLSIFLPLVLIALSSSPVMPWPLCGLQLIGSPLFFFFFWKRAFYYFYVQKTQQHPLSPVWWPVL